MHESDPLEIYKCQADEILALVLEIINIHQTIDRAVFNTLPAIRNWLAVKYKLSISENMSQSALEQADAWIWNVQVPRRWDPCTYVWDHQNLSNIWQSSLLHSASYPVKYRLSMLENMSQNALEQADAWIWNIQMPSRWDPCARAWDHQNSSDTWQSSLLHSSSHPELACSSI